MNANRKIAILPRREREIFEIICSAGELSAADIRSRMADQPGQSAVRTLLVRLEQRGLVTYRVDGKAYLYRSVPHAEQVRHSALRQLVDTLFNGSAASAATALLGLSPKISAKELDALRRIVDQARPGE